MFILYEHVAILQPAWSWIEDPNTAIVMPTTVCILGTFEKPMAQQSMVANRSHTSTRFSRHGRISPPQHGGLQERVRAVGMRIWNEHMSKDCCSSLPATDDLIKPPRKEEEAALGIPRR